MLPAFLPRDQQELRLRLRQLSRSIPRLNAITARPALLPVVEVVPKTQRQPRELAICQGLVYLVLMLVVSGAYFVAWCTAERVSVAFAPVALVVVVHIVYLNIYALERCGVIDGERCDSLIKCVEGLCPVENFFMPTPPTLVWPRRVLTLLARSLARVVTQADQEEDRQ